MIISASRRTDIPAFYAEWFMLGLERGFVEVRNPFNARQVRKVSLLPADVTAFVFWTRNARPLRPHLPRIEDMGVPFYFQFSITGYDRMLERSTPPLSAALEEFQILSESLGPSRVIWRYDPIIFSRHTPHAWHEDMFARLARNLQGKTRRVVVSFADDYGRVRNNLAKVPDLDARTSLEEQVALAPFLKKTAQACGLQLQTCAEKAGASGHALPPGRCIDDELLGEIGSKPLHLRKDKGQREECLCVQSVDIGAYDTCLHGCIYCYATTRPDFARRNHHKHDPHSTTLV